MNGCPLTGRYATVFVIHQTHNRGNTGPLIHSDNQRGRGRDMLPFQAQLIQRDRSLWRVMAITIA